MGHPVLYRKRFMPQEIILLRDDILVYQDEKVIVTKWNVFRPKAKFSHGVSCYFLEDGYKVSKFLNDQEELVYYYCDIIDTTYDAQENSYLSKQRNTVLNSTYLYAGAQGQFKKYLSWDATGKYNFLGHEINDFGVQGNISFSTYPFRKERNSPITLAAHFETNLTEPDHYQQRILTNHYKWENDFGKISDYIS